MNDFVVIYNYLKKQINKQINNLKFKQENLSFTDILLQPDGAKHLNSIYMGKNQIFGFNTTLYKIKKENEDFFYASYVYKKNFTQVILTDDWEKMKNVYQYIYKNNQSVIIDIEDKKKGGISKNAKKSRLGRTKL